MANWQMDHVGVAVADLEQAIASYRDIFGYELVSGPFDDPVQQARVCFLGNDAADQTVIELIAPIDEKSHVASMVAKGIGAYHVCYRVRDIEGELARVRAKRCLIVKGPDPAVAYGGRRVAWFFTPTKQLVELVEWDAA